MESGVNGVRLKGVQEISGPPQEHAYVLVHRHGLDIGTEGWE